MNWSFLVIDFIIFTVAASVGFIFGAFWVDSEFEKDSAYLAAEVESLNEALDVLEEQYQELFEQYRQSIEDGNKVFDSLQRSVDAYEELKNFTAKNKNTNSAYLFNKIREALEQANRDIDLG